MATAAQAKQLESPKTLDQASIMNATIELCARAADRYVKTLSKTKKQVCSTVEADQQDYAEQVARDIAQEIRGMKKLAL